MFLLKAVTALNGLKGKGGGRGVRYRSTSRHCSSIHHADSADYYCHATSAYLRIPFTKIRVGLKRVFVDAHNSFWFTLMRGVILFTYLVTRQRKKHEK